MRNRASGSMLAGAVVMAWSLVPAPGACQSASTATKTWNPPHTADGQPDVQGFWVRGGGATDDDIELGTVSNRFLGAKVQPSEMIVDPVDRKIPYQAWAAARRKDIIDRRENPKPNEIDPVARCDLPGVPRSSYSPAAVQILQPPGHVVMLSEAMHAYRIIRLDQRPHLGENLKLWMGDSRGHWEGETLVIDVTNNNDETWLDTAANFHSDALHVVERWTFADADTINYEATLIDPKVYTQPWRIAFPLVRNREAGYELLEFACHEGERSVDLMLRRAKSEKDQ